MSETKVNQLTFWEQPPAAAWVDYTRRNDPATPFWARRLQEKLAAMGRPDVLCFWTKAPAVVAHLFRGSIRSLQDAGTLVLAQVTDNHYGQVLEPGILPERADLEPLVALLGAERIRLRFDPILPGFSTAAHFQACLEDALRFGIQRITLNWIILSYKNVATRLRRAGIALVEASEDEHVVFARELLTRAGGRVELAVCAESHNLVQVVPELKTAACADMGWAVELRPDLAGRLKQRASRPGCGCCYIGDWGEYVSRGGSKCVHGCLYCYAGT